MAKITDAYLRSLKGSERIREELVEQGLYLKLTLRKDGGTTKRWVLRYSDSEGNQNKYTFGEYPEMGLAEARIRADELRKQVKRELAPGVTLAAQARQEAQAEQTEQARQGEPATTFKDMAEEWLAVKASVWAPSHTIRQRERMGAVYRVFGERDINTVDMDCVMSVVRLKVKQGAYETASRIVAIIRSVLAYADTMGRLADNRILLRIDNFNKTIAAPHKEKHLYQELSDKQIGKLLDDIDRWFGRLRIGAAMALKLAPYLVVRPNELCGARWDEIDLDKAEWVIPADRMKMRREHIVPLPRQAVSQLSEYRPVADGEFLFPTCYKRRDGEPIPTATLVRALRKMGYASSQSANGVFFTTHGFRGMASTLLYQRLNFPGHLIELQLAHVDENKVRAAYNRVHSRSWLEERRQMLQAYADFLDKLKADYIEKEGRR